MVSTTQRHESVGITYASVCVGEYVEPMQHGRSNRIGNSGEKSGVATLEDASVDTLHGVRLELPQLLDGVRTWRL